MPAHARTIAFVASCLNEEGNLIELHRRCLAAFRSFIDSREDPETWRFAMTLADNGSRDRTAQVLQSLREADPRVRVLINARNYGPEPSVVNAFAHTEADVLVLLASDLQDPPELVVVMLQRLLQPGSSSDAVLACKRTLPKGPLVQLGRWIYYRMLAFGSRGSHAPNGFHGFGVYRAEVIQDSVELWRQTAINLRQAITRSSHASAVFQYDSAERSAGRSSYGLLAYVREGMITVLSGDAITTRVTMLLGLGSLVLAMLLGLVIVAYVLHGNSGYAAGIPTVMLLVLVSLGMQSLLLSLLAFQIENLNLPIRRPNVRLRCNVNDG